MTAPAYDKVLMHKAKVIERCVQRAREEHLAAQGHFSTDHTRQDVAVLNLQRACEAALDMAQRIISVNGWGVAEASKELFAILRRKAVINAAMEKTLVNMVGFRKLAVHDYEELNYSIVESIITKDCTDLLSFSKQIIQQFFSVNTELQN